MNQVGEGRGEEVLIGGEMLLGQEVGREWQELWSAEETTLLTTCTVALLRGQKKQASRLSAHGQALLLFGGHRQEHHAREPLWSLGMP